MHNTSPEPADVDTMVFAPSLERLAQVDTSDHTVLQSVRAEWSEIFAQDFGHFDGLYALILGAGNTLVDAQSPLDLPHAFTNESATVFLAAAADTSYLRAIGSLPEIQTRLAQHNKAIVSLLRQMIAAAQQRPELTRPISALITLYFHHGDADEDLCADVALVIPDALLRFPRQSFPFAVFLLARSANAAEELYRVVALPIVERGDVIHEACHEVAEGALGLTSRQDSTLSKLGPAILGPVARAVRDERPDILDDFVSTVVLAPLGCTPRTRKTETERLEAELARLDTQLRSFEEQLKAPVPVTAQDTPLVLDISRTKAELERVRNDFDAWMDERWNRAVRQVAAQPTKRATLQAIQSGLAPLTSAELERFLADAATAQLGTVPQVAG